MAPFASYLRSWRAVVAYMVIGLPACGPVSIGRALAPGDDVPGPFRIVSRTPAAFAVDVPSTTEIVVVFSREVRQTQLVSDHMHVSIPGRSVSGDFVVEGGTITFTPQSPIPIAAQVTVFVDSELFAATGESLGTSDSWTFRTGNGTWGEPTTVNTGGNLIAAFARSGGTAWAAGLLSAANPSTSTPFGPLTQYSFDQTASLDVGAVVLPDDWRLDEFGDAADANGFACATFDANGSHEIWAMTRRLGSIHWSAPIRIDDDGLGSGPHTGRQPRVVCDGRIAAVVWQGENLPGAKPIYCRVFDRLSELWGGVNAVYEGMELPDGYAVAANFDSVVVAWIRRGREIWNRRFRLGFGWNEPELVVDNAPRDVADISLALGQSTAFLVWTDRALSTDVGGVIVCNRFDVVTQVWSPRESVSLPGNCSNCLLQPHVEMIDGAYALVHWSAPETAIPPTTTIVVRRYDLALELWREQLELDGDEFHNARNLSVSFDNNKNATLVWDQRASLVAPTRQAFARRYLFGGSWSTAIELTPGLNAIGPRAASLPDGRTLVLAMTAPYPSVEYVQVILQ